MNIVQIKTIGEVALKSSVNSSVGYLYDVPMDDLGIPYLPLSTILAEAGCLPQGVQLSFAHMEGYMGLTKSANVLKETINNCVPVIRSCFVNERFIPEKMQYVRSLKAGQTLEAHIFFDEENEETVREALESITHMGVADEGITGEVSVCLMSVDNLEEDPHVLSDKCSYASLDVAYLLRTPACFYAPYADGAATQLYIPGAVLRTMLMQKLKHKTIDWDQTIFSHGYITMDKQRLLPTPICASVVKLDKEQLRYRLAPGKKSEITEQDKVLEGSFTNESQQHLMRYTIPETEHILSQDGTIYDALSPGQVFQGRIYGSDNDIRKIVQHIYQHPIANIGVFAEEGFGEVYCKIVGVHEKEIPAQYLQSCFDVCCASDTLILDDAGMPTCRAEDLKEAIEYVLGIPGRLRIAGRYTNVFHDFSQDPYWKEDRNVTRCFAGGSILRLEAIGEPVDIYPIRHCFVGERIQDGYGEICTWPARGEYYRLGEIVPSSHYDMQFKESHKSIVMGARLIKTVISTIIRKRIENIAAVDRSEYELGYSVEELIPRDILNMFRAELDPLLSEEELIEWYRNALEGGQDYEGQSR